MGHKQDEGTNIYLLETSFSSGMGTKETALVLKLSYHWLLKKFKFQGSWPKISFV